MGQQANAIQRMNNLTEVEQDNLTKLQNGNVNIPVKNTVSKELISEQEYINASTFDNNLKNLIMPGEYYLTSAQTEAFTDYPDEIRGTGAWLRVSSGNAGGQVRQELTTNSSSYLGKSYRNVYHEDKTALFDWITYYPIPRS